MAILLSKEHNATPRILWLNPGQRATLFGMASRSIFQNLVPRIMSIQRRACWLLGALILSKWMQSVQVQGLLTVVLILGLTSKHGQMRLPVKISGWNFSGPCISMILVRGSNTPTAGVAISI